MSASPLHIAPARILVHEPHDGLTSHRASLSETERVWRRLQASGRLVACGALHAREYNYNVSLRTTNLNVPN